MAPDPALAASLGSKLGFTWDPPSLTQAAAICTLFYSSCGVAPRITQVGADHGLHPRENPELVHPVHSYRSCRSTTTLTLTADPPQGTEVGGQWSQLDADWPE